MSEVTPTYDKRKMWKLVLLVVPAIISGASSYAKSRAEATDQAKAAFEHIEKVLDGLEADRDAVKAENVVQKEQLEAVNRRLDQMNQLSIVPGIQPLRPPSRPSDLFLAVQPSPPDRDGIRDAIPRHKPSSFEDVVQSYKSKK